MIHIRPPTKLNAKRYVNQQNCKNEEIKYYLFSFS